MRTLTQQDNDNYIVRIYRRSADEPDHIVGLAEHVATQRRWSFLSLTELCNILRHAESAETKKANKGELR